MQIRKFLLTSALYLSAACVTTPALADSDDKERRHGKAATEQAEASPQNGHGKQKALPPGLAKKVARGGELPPGWKKKLARGEVLPQEVYDAGKPVAPDVKKRLPPEKKGEITVQVEDKIVRVVEKTRKITDVIDDIRELRR